MNSPFYTVFYKELLTQRTPFRLFCPPKANKNPLENILIIDMTTTSVAVFLTYTLRTFNRRNAISTVMIKVANGSFTIDANELLQLLGSEAACTLLFNGDVLEIRVGCETVASLVMTSVV